MLTLADVLSPEDLARVRDGLAAVAFRDGRATASGAARRVKSNRQAPGEDGRVEALARFVREALVRHPVFSAYVRPARWSGITFSRYGPGDAYGLHVDAPFMAAAEGGSLRTDLSFTLFLSDPETYSGGELEIEGLDGTAVHRPQAGSAVVYPTGRLHQVRPVTGGERLVAIGWIESRIRRADQRETLFDLERVRASLPPGEARQLMDKALGDLLRQWGEA